MPDAFGRVKKEAWNRLYRAAGEYYALAPWRWMKDYDLFGVRNPADGEIGYCSVMGNLGEHLALGVFLGPEGLWGLDQVQEAEGQMDIGETLFTQTMLMASFEDRDVLEDRDRSVIKALGLKFRGRQTWPLFRSYLPGTQPWFLDSEEVEFLTLALEQAVQVCTRRRDEGLELDYESEGETFLFCRALDAETGEWRDEWVVGEMQPPAVVEPGEVDPDRIQALRQLPRSDHEIEIGYFPGPGVVQANKDERPFIPLAVMISGHSAPLPLGFDMCALAEVGPTLVEVLLQFLERTEARVRMVWVDDDAVEETLEPLLTALGIEISTAEYLDNLRGISDMLENMM